MSEGQSTKEQEEWVGLRQCSRTAVWKRERVDQGVDQHDRQASPEHGRRGDPPSAQSPLPDHPERFPEPGQKAKNGDRCTHPAHHLADFLQGRDPFALALLFRGVVELRSMTTLSSSGTEGRSAEGIGKGLESDSS